MACGHVMSSVRDTMVWNLSHHPGACSIDDAPCIDSAQGFQPSYKVWDYTLASGTTLLRKPASGVPMRAPHAHRSKTHVSRAG
jgi:hypothetical protein